MTHFTRCTAVRDPPAATATADHARCKWIPAGSVEWGREADLRAAEEIHRRYRALRMGLVDAIVIAVAERVRADGIATLDLRHFGAVRIKGDPRLLPRDA